MNSRNKKDETSDRTTGCVKNKALESYKDFFFYFLTLMKGGPASVLFFCLPCSISGKKYNNKKLKMRIIEVLFFDLTTQNKNQFLVDVCIENNS